MAEGTDPRGRSNPASRPRRVLVRNRESPGHEKTKKCQRSRLLVGGVTKKFCIEQKGPAREPGGPNVRPTPSGMDLAIRNQLDQLPINRGLCPTTATLSRRRQSPERRGSLRPHRLLEPAGSPLPRPCRCSARTGFRVRCV